MQSHSCASFVGEESDSALDPASTREDFSGSAFWPERKDVAEIAPAAATSAVVTGKGIQQHIRTGEYHDMAVSLDSCLDKYGPQY